MLSLIYLLIFQPYRHYTVPAINIQIPYQCISHTAVYILLCTGIDIASVIVADDLSFFLSDLRGRPLFLAKNEQKLFHKYI